MSTATVLPPPTKDGTPLKDAKIQGYFYMGPLETPNAWDKWERDVLANTLRMKFAVFRNRRSGSMLELDFESTGCIKFNEKYSEKPWHIFSNGVKTRGAWSCPRLAYEMERKLRTGKLHLSEEEEQFGNWTAVVRGRAIGISSIIPGRDPAACAHVVLLPDEIIFISEQVSVNIQRHALSSKGGVQLKEMDVGKALGIIGLKEIKLIIEKPITSDMNQARLALVAANTDEDPPEPDAVGYLRRAISLYTTNQKRQEGCMQEFFGMPGGSRALAVSAVEQEYLDHLLTFGHLTEIEHERLSGAIKARPEVPAAALTQDEAKLASMFLDPETRQRLPQVHFRAWDRLSWAEKLEATRTVEAKKRGGHDIFDAEIDGLKVDSLMRMTMSDVGVVMAHNPNDDAGSEDEFDLADLKGDDEELPPERTRHPLFKQLVAGENAAGVKRWTRKGLENVVDQWRSHSGNEIQQFYEECDMCGRQCSIAGSGLCDRCRKFEDDRFKLGFTEDTTRPGTYYGDARALLGHEKFKDVGYILSRPPINRGKMDQSMFKWSMVERQETLDRARSTAAKQVDHHAALEAAELEERQARKSTQLNLLQEMQSDSRVVKKYDATGVSMAAAVLGPPQDHEIAKFLQLVRNNRFDEVRELLHRSSQELIFGDGCMRILNTRDEHGNTGIVIAAQQGLKKMVRMLIQAEADVNSQNKQGNTALHYAFAYNLDAVAELLIDYGADEAIANKFGQVPVDMAPKHVGPRRV